MTDTDTTPSRTCSRRDLELIDAYWRAANYLSVGQIYLLDNPLLRPQRAVRHRPWTWRTGPGGQRLPGGNLQRGLLQRFRAETAQGRHRAVDSTDGYRRRRRAAAPIRGPAANGVRCVQ